MLGIFLDIETNGLNFFIHKPIEIAFSIINLDTGREVALYQSIISISDEDWEKSNPTSLKVNGFTRETVSKGIDIATVSQEITSILNQHKCIQGESVFICQNPSFDRNFFSQIIGQDEQHTHNWPYHWLDLASMFWALYYKEHSSIVKRGLSKDKIAAFLDLPPEEHPHKAFNGVAHLVDCYRSLIGFPKE